MPLKYTKREGAALVEFSIVLPILFLLFAAMLEIGRMLLLQQTADTAAYEGARHAMVPGATAEEAVEAARILLKQSRIVNAKVVIDPAELDEKTAAISVHVAIPLNKNCWFFKTWSSNKNVTSDVTLIAERVPFVQLTGIDEIHKKAKEKGGGKGKVDL